MSHTDWVVSHHELDDAPSMLVGLALVRGFRSVCLAAVGNGYGVLGEPPSGLPVLVHLGEDGTVDYFAA